MASNQDAAVTAAVTYDSGLVESVMRLHVDAASPEDAGWIPAYRAELDEIYDLPDWSRETAFAALDRRYFQRVGVPTVVDTCLAERAAVMSNAVSITMLTAQSRAEEGADVDRAGRLIFRFRPSTLLGLDRFRRRLRRELLQAADCFDPNFGHAPELLDALLPSEKERVRIALSLLWGMSAQARLCAEERACQGEVSMIEQANLERLTTDALSALGEGSDREIGRIVTDLPDRPPTFREMLALCRERQGSAAVAAGICDLCRFPAEDALFLNALADDVIQALKTEFPQLHDAARVCGRCVERTEFSRGGRA